MTYRIDEIYDLSYMVTYNKVNKENYTEIAYIKAENIEKAIEKYKAFLPYYATLVGYNFR